MAIFMERGLSAKEQDNSELRRTVEGIISDVKARGEQAVRELSAGFDNWSPPRAPSPRPCRPRSSGS
jgi:sulfopropanediol 3-dehydrogenase